MDRQLAQYFFDEASKAFAFVVSEFDFAPPRLEVDDRINFAYVLFMGKNLAIECGLDEREGDISCIIARVIGGTRATYRDAIDEPEANGVRVREYLSKFLERRGVRERLFTKVTGLGPRERIKVTLTDFATMLRKYGQEILGDSPSALA